MSERARGRKRYRIRVVFTPDNYPKDSHYAYSEEEAIEKFKEEYEQEILHNWISYVAEEEEEEG